jgi:predicted NUDIX family NTP pyrophosphohydrolase
LFFFERHWKRNMPKHSAGVLMYRRRSGRLEVFLVHPGGPFWAKKDLGAWSIPKGEYTAEETAEAAAAREFREETGFNLEGRLHELGMVKQAGGKIVSAWCIEGDCDPADLMSNMVQMEWPPHSGRRMEFPEVDAGGWFPLAVAREKMLKSQSPLLDMLERTLAPDTEF